jgi:hypothetical protein
VTERRRTGGRWEPQRRFRYFPVMGGDCHHCDFDTVLIAMDEVRRDPGPMLTQMARGAQVLLDSGVFIAASNHAKAHQMDMGDALALPPESIDGWSALEQGYLETVQKYGNDLWGYIELDQGVTAQKRATRRRLESMGLGPIPVYTPVNDPPSYLDELCQEYDRIAVGGIVRLSAPAKIRVFHAVWERTRKYPDVWVHLLGVNPDHRLHAYPAASCDSSTWMDPVRWGRQTLRSCGAPFGKLPPDFVYALGSDKSAPGGREDGFKLACYVARFDDRNWSSYLAGLDRVTLG